MHCDIGLHVASENGHMLPPFGSLESRARRDPDVAIKAYETLSSRHRSRLKITASWANSDNNCCIFRTCDTAKVPNDAISARTIKSNQVYLYSTYPTKINHICV